MSEEPFILWQTKPLNWKALDTYILSAVYIVTEESPLPFLSSSYVCILSYLQCK